MKIGIRCDASAELGYGHLLRTLVLVKELRQLAIDVVYLTRTPDAVLECSREFDTKVITIPREFDSDQEIQLVAQQAGLVVLDLLENNQEYQRGLVEAGCELMVIDGSRLTPTYGRWLVDPKPRPLPEHFDQRIRVRSETEYLAGPKFALYDGGRPVDPSNRMLNQVTISMGGGDDRGSICMILQLFDEFPQQLILRIQTRSSNPNVREIQQQAERSHHQVLVIIDESLVSAATANSRLAILAGGVSCYQLASMGVPFLLMPIAENQETAAADWVSLGVGALVGNHLECDSNRFSSELERLLTDDSWHSQCSAAGLELCDGLGARRLAEKLHNHLN